MRPPQNDSASVKIWATALDFGASSALFFFLLLSFGIAPRLDAIALAYLMGWVLAVWIIQKALFKKTLGDLMWEGAPSPLKQSIGAFLTVGSFIATLWLAYASVALNPIGMRAGSDEWSAFFPGSTESEKWNILPFFYSLGAWPSTFQGQDIFYSLPYQKGPPERFAGEAVALWKSSEVKVTFEGPKSPLRGDQTPFDRKEIRDCVQNLWTSGTDHILNFPHCLAVRNAVLGRHFESLRKIHPIKWRLRWIQVSNPAIPAEQQVQGIDFSVSGESRSEDRFILITPKGTHQTFVLDYPNSSADLPQKDAAQTLFQNALRSLRISDDLTPGKTWVDQRLSEINLRDTAKAGVSDASIRDLANVQALLIARISVDPKSFDTYFHLAGTALMLGRYASQLRQLPPPKGNPERSAELLTIAKPTVQIALRYAQDIAPKNERLTLMQGFWAEAQKF